MAARPRVNPHYRNLGYGRQLTLASLERMSAMGIPEVHLTVKPDNEMAIALYKTSASPWPDCTRTISAPVRIAWS